MSTTSILNSMPHGNHPNTPDSSPETSDSESHSSETESILQTVTEPDVSLDEMLSLACRQGKLDIVQLLLQSGAHVNHRNKAGNTPLLEACSQGHVAVANYLLENGSKINTPTETTLDSALTWACTLGNTSIVNALLYKKADVEHRTKDGCTALMFACLAGHREVAEKLLDANSEINVESSSNKDSPLTFACWKGHYDVVSLLLKRKANIEHRTKEGFSPLMFAALGGHMKVARKLLGHNAQVNVPSGSNNDIPLTSACWKGHQEVVKLLLEFASHIEHRTKDGCTPLMLAAREGHLSVAELLLLNHAQVNVPSGSENNIPLTLACWKGHWGVVRLLLNYGSDIEHRNKAGCTPLMLAAREGHFETTALLLERKAEVNVPSGSNDDTPLTLACWKGHKDVVLLLLDNKSNIDHQTKTGCTPLMEATREGHCHVAETLLSHNADVELPDNYGQSPLFMACWKGHSEVAELLLSRGAYRDCRTKTGITPLFQACRENHVSIVNLLLNFGAGINAPFPNSRENPMTLCAEKGHKELVELFLEKGASQDCRTKKGCTPAFLACKEGHLDIAQLLAKHSANMEMPDCRGNTPIMAAFKNGHVMIVEWLIKFVHHLPSDELCHKILMSSVDDKEKETIVQHKSKCLGTIQETKKKRELLALKNAQNLVQELDDERNREENKKKKAAAKRRDKRNKRKKNRDEQTMKVNGIIVNVEDDEIDDEEMKDNLMPTENRDNTPEEDLTSEMLAVKISELPSVVDITEKCADPKHLRKKSKRKSVTSKSLRKEIENVTMNTPVLKMKNKTIESTPPFDVKLLVNQLSANPSAIMSLKKCNLDMRQLAKTSGVCTQSTSTLGPSRSAVPCHTDKTKRTSQALSSHSKSNHSSAIVSSVAATTATQATSVQSDPRTQVCNITPASERPGDEKKCNKTSTVQDVIGSSLLSRNSSFEEYRESDWKEVAKTPKSVAFELTVPNGYCGRVIGKGGKKINLITEESGSQITIDKPAANVVPADRIITIKGSLVQMEKARYLVTRALNTPSLTTRSVGMCESGFVYKDVKCAGSTKADEQRPKKSEKVRCDNAPVKPSLSYSKVATTGVSYSKVATRTIHSDEKQLQKSIPANDNDLEIGSPVVKDKPRCSSASFLKSTNFASKNFSYFSKVAQADEVPEKKANLSISSYCGTASNVLSSTQEKDKRNSLEIPDTSSFDRNRSISLTEQHETSPPLKVDQPSTRSLSTEAINDRQGAVVSPWNLSKDASDVFSDDVTWSHKQHDIADGVWEVSSSPHSSVSSSKVELANILDNETPLGVVTTPTPEHISQVLENAPWLQSRGAYSAPSSPSLLHGPETRNQYLKQQNIRSHTSVEELNSSRPPWQYKREPTAWVPSDSNGKSEHDRRLSSPDKLATVLNDEVQPSTWSAERFQHTRSVNELFRHLSLEKYIMTFEEHGINLDSLVTLTEKDLAAYSIPKGPRLKILKACQVIQGQRRPNKVPIMAPNMASFRPPFTSPSSDKTPTPHPYPPSLSGSDPNKAAVYSNGGFRYNDFLSYGPMQHSQYNLILPPEQQAYIPQHFSEDMLQQRNQMHNNQQHVVTQQHGFMFSDQSYYFYPQQS